MCSDNRHIVCGALNQKQWVNFCEAITTGVPAARLANEANAQETAQTLANHPKFQTNALRVTHRQELVDLLANCFFKHLPADGWASLFTQFSIPHSLVQSVEEVMQDPQVQHLGLVKQITHPFLEQTEIKVTGNPVKFSRTPVTQYKYPPLLAEDTVKILKDKLKMKEKDISDLIQTGVICTNELTQ